MKKILLSLFAVSVLFACSKKDDKVSDTEADDSYTVSFIKQPAQGKIKGTTFEYITGTFIQDHFKTDKFEIELFDKADFDTVGIGKLCGLGFYGTTRECYFSIPKVVGRYELGTSTHATFKTGELNTALPMALKGAIEIISVTDTKMVGRIDAYESENNHINGDFTVEFCTE